MTRIRINAAADGRKRTAMARVSVRDGKAIVECPFCFPAHPISVGEAAKCGTSLELRAVQRIYNVAKCAKCGGTTGTFVKIGENYQHAHDCTPGKVLLAEDPVPSRSAQLAYRVPWLFRKRRLSQAPTRLARDGKVIYAWLNR